MLQRGMMRTTTAQIVPRALFLIAGTGLGVLLLLLLLRSVSLDQVGDALGSADYTFLGLAVIPFLANWLLKLPRWALLFGDDAPGWDTLFGALNVGYAINALLPARLGEIVRAYWVRDRAGVGMVRTLATIALERVLDGVSLVLLLLILLPFVGLPGELVGPAVTIGVVFMGTFLGMIAVAYTSRHERSLVSTLLGRLETTRAAPIARAVRQIVHGLQVLHHVRSLLLVLGYTAVIWATNVLFTWLLLQAFHIDVPAAAATLLTAVLNLGMAVPSSPGYVGVYEYLMVLTLGLYNVARAPALAAALILHLIAFGVVTVVGLAYILRALGSTIQMLRMSLTRTG